jgi:hypothetical protein
MGRAVAIRDDIPAKELRRLARLEDDSRVTCRLLALAVPSGENGLSLTSAAHLRIVLLPRLFSDLMLPPACGGAADQSQHGRTSAV